MREATVISLDERREKTAPRARLTAAAVAARRARRTRRLQAIINRHNSQLMLVRPLAWASHD
jgi:hypothetical protein